MPAGATVITADGLSFEQTVATVVACVRERIAQPAKAAIHPRIEA